MKTLLLTALLFEMSLVAQEPATVMSAAAPGYPQMASGGRLEGEVAVDLEVMSDGVVRRAQAQSVRRC